MANQLNNYAMLTPQHTDFPKSKQFNALRFHIGS